MIKHIKLWWRWAKHCLNSWPYKVLVLFGLTYSPSFKMYEKVEYYFKKHNHKCEWSVKDDETK